MSQLASFIRSLKGQDFIVLDTETTGLNDGEIVSLAIINHLGETVFNSLIKPKYPIPMDATRIHGINDASVQDSPTWPVMADRIEQIITGRNVVVYNAVYDRKMFHKTAERWGMNKTEWKEISSWFCCMEAFAEFYGDYNEYRGTYVWKKLVEAARYTNYPSFAAHGALADCHATLHVTDYLLNYDPENPEILKSENSDQES